MLVRPAPVEHPGYDCTAEGYERVVTAQLQTSLGRRAIYDIGYLPPRKVRPSARE